MRNIWLFQIGLLSITATLIGCSNNVSQPPSTDELDDATPLRTTPPPYWVYVTNEGSGDVTFIAGDTHEVTATLPLGKRPRGIKASPDGQYLFVALSGSPPAPPGIDESTLPPPDRTADGIGVVDLATRQVNRIIKGGTDPEQVALSLDGSRLYVANEDMGTTSVVDIETGDILAVLEVGDEPEGVTTSPNGSVVYVTSEEHNQVSVIDVESNQIIKQFKVGPRPRTSAFSPDGTRAYVTSENGGSLSIVDTSIHEVLTTVDVPGTPSRPMGVTVSPDGARVAFTTG